MAWRIFARAFGVALALAAAAGGAVLIAPEFAPAYAVPQGMGVLGGFLIVTALLSLIVAGVNAARLSGRGADAFVILIRMPLLVCSMIALVLAAKGLLAGLYPLALLIIPALGAFLVQQGRVARYGKTSLSEIGLTPGDGQAPTPGEIFRATLRASGSVLNFIVSLWPVPVGIAVYAVLEGLLFDGRPAQLAGFLTAFAGQDWLIGYALIALVPYPLITLAAGINENARYWGVKDGNRNLSLRELSTIEESVERTIHYTERAMFPDRDRWLTGVNLGAYAVYGLIAVALFFAFKAIAAPAPAASSLWYYSDDGRSVFFFGATAYVAAFTGFPMVVLARLWRRYAERAGWQQLFRSNGYPGVTERILVLVRRRELADPFEPSAFLHRQATRMHPLAAFVLAALIVATAAVKLHDAVKLDTIGPRGITVVNDLTLTPHHYAFAEVRALWLRCEQRDDETAVIGVTLELPGGDSVDLIEGRFASGNFSDAVRIDDILRRQGTPVRFVTGEDGKVLMQPACLRAMARRLGEDPERLDRVFHVDAWQHLRSR